MTDVNPTEKTHTRRVVLRGVRLIHAGPTSGKTYMARELMKKGIRLIESDSIRKVLAPEWESLNGFKMNTEVSRAWERVMNSAVAGAMSCLLDSGAVHLVVSNMYSTDFVKAISPKWLASGHIPVSLFVEAEEMARRSKERGDKGGGLPLDLTRKWQRDWEQAAKSEAGSGTKHILLREGEFLGTVLDIRLPEVQAEKMNNVDKILSTLGSMYRDMWDNQLKRLST